MRTVLIASGVMVVACAAACEIAFPIGPEYTANDDHAVSDAAPPNCEAGGTGIVCSGTCVDPNNDGKNCGKCGHDCLCNAACQGGVCQPFVISSNEEYPYDLAADPTDLYWLRWGGEGGIRKASLATCAVSDVVTGLRDEPTSIALDDASVFYGSHSGGYIGQCAKAGCATPTRFPGDASTDPRGVAVDNTFLYWTSNADTSGVFRCNKSSCAATIVEMADAAVVARAYRLALDTNNLYTAGLDTVVQIPLDGAPPTTLATQVNGGTINGRGIAVDTLGKVVYWTDYSGTTGYVASCNIGKSCGASPTLFAGPAFDPQDITVDGVNVYWTVNNSGDAGAGTLMQCAVGTCQGLTPRVMGLYNPARVVTTPSAVYWVNAGNKSATGSDGAVMGLAK